jgi:hypothetical protein
MYANPLLLIVVAACQLASLEENGLPEQQNLPPPRFELKVDTNGK